MGLLVSRARPRFWWRLPVTSGAWWVPYVLEHRLLGILGM